MCYFHKALICQNGHVLSSTLDFYPGFESPFCPECGSKTISFCPNCNAPIRGIEDDRLIYEYHKPSYCHNCGSPYPWTETALKAASLLIQYDENLDDEQKEDLASCLPDLITETPSTTLSATKLRRAFTKVGKYTADGLRQFSLDFFCELALKLLGF